MSENSHELAKQPPRMLTRQEFQGLAEVPAELEWFANITNKNTRRAYVNDVKEFMGFVGILEPEEFRVVARAHIIAFRDFLYQRDLAAATIRRKMAAISSLFNYLCERNAVTGNPTQGVKRPQEGSNEGKTPALGDDESKVFLDAPPEDTLKGLRDRAILATFLYHGLRYDELARLVPADMQARRGVPHLKILGKGSKIRYIPVHPAAQSRILDYLAVAGHAEEHDAPLFRPVKNPSQGNDLERRMSQSGIYQSVVCHWAKHAGLDVRAVCIHAMRTTAATNALDHKADIAKVQEWLGHSDISTTRLYDRRKSKPEDSPTFRINY